MAIANIPSFRGDLEWTRARVVRGRPGRIVFILALAVMTVGLATVTWLYL
jgi:hypothetical protein